MKRWHDCTWVHGVLCCAALRRRRLLCMCMYMQSWVESRVCVCVCVRRAQADRYRRRVCTRFVPVAKFSADFSFVTKGCTLGCRAYEIHTYIPIHAHTHTHTYTNTTTHTQCIRTSRRTANSRSSLSYSNLGTLANCCRICKVNKTEN